MELAGIIISVLLICSVFLNINLIGKAYNSKEINTVCFDIIKQYMEKTEQAKITINRIASLDVASDSPEVKKVAVTINQLSNDINHLAETKLEDYISIDEDENEDE